jgi:hypothetical protein
VLHTPLAHWTTQHSARGFLDGQSWFCDQWPRKPLHHSVQHHVLLPIRPAYYGSIDELQQRYSGGRRDAYFDLVVRARIEELPRSEAWGDAWRGEEALQDLIQVVFA